MEALELNFGRVSRLLNVCVFPPIRLRNVSIYMFWEGVMTYDWLSIMRCVII